MPTNFVISRAGDFSTTFRANEGTVYSDLDANPGTTEADLVLRTGIAAQTVSNMLHILRSLEVVVKAQDLSGNERYWTATDWANAVIAKRAAARTWLDTAAAGAQVSDLAAVLVQWGLPADEALALRLTHLLEGEGIAESRAPIA